MTSAFSSGLVQRLVGHLRRRMTRSADESGPIPQNGAAVHGGTHSSRRLNLLAEAIGAQSYLEIGVQTGATFFNVAVPNKVAVDPAFAFDPADRAGPGLSFHAVPSDAYFAIAGDARFDVAFIDGLHTFEQVQRDFDNVLRHVGPGAIILIDDTLPSDRFSAEAPTGEEAVRRRRAAGIDGDMSWHGDVYKLIFTLHDFYPDFDFCGIADNGNPQTLAWRTPNAAPRKPRFGNREAIAVLDWNGLQANMDVLRLISERDAIARCLKSRS